MLIAQLEDPYLKKVMDSQRAWVERVTYYELMNAPDYALAYEHNFPDDWLSSAMPRSAAPGFPRPQAITRRRIVARAGRRRVIRCF
ncbi:MAG: hypothetical protein R3D52_05290 [Xanthobacteraceae bacterium]